MYVDRGDLDGVTEYAEVCRLLVKTVHGRRKDVETVNWNNLFKGISLENKQIDRCTSTKCYSNNTILSWICKFKILSRQ